MNSNLTPGDGHELAKGFTVADYVRLRSNQDRRGIAELIRRRFRLRYLDPITITQSKSGFCMVAVGCLMIEALESFYQGWPTSDHKSKSAFCQFISREPGFALLKAHAEAFYHNVRCGILHQAETTGGWRIRRDLGGLLFDAAAKTLDANEFINALSASLDDYCRRLESAAWTDVLRINATKKLDAICDQCSA